MNYGELRPLLSKRSKVDIAYIEVAGDMSELAGAIVVVAAGGAEAKDRAGQPKFILYGSPEEVRAFVADTIDKLSDGNAPLAGYKRREILFSFPRDEVFGPRLPGQTSLSPKKCISVACFYSVSSFLMCVCQATPLHPVVFSPSCSPPSFSVRLFILCSFVLRSLSFARVIL